MTTYKCNHDLEYAYKEINKVEISTLLILSDIRNSMDDSYATLAVAFTDTDPGSMSDSQLESLSWMRENSDMTIIYDFRTDTEKP